MHTIENDVVNHPRLSVQAIEALTQIVTEEVTAALSHMHAYKSPNSNGFQGIFLKQYWHTVGKGVSNLIDKAFQTGTFESALGETLVALIPKVDSPKTLKEF